MWTTAPRERYKDDGRRYPSDLTDAERALIAPVFACYATLTVDLRERVNAFLYLHKTGCQWRFLPTDFGPWQTVRSWHDRFRADGVWTDAAAILPDRAAEEGWAPKRLKVDGIDLGARMASAAERHSWNVQVAARAPDARSVTPLPLR